MSEKDKVFDSPSNNILMHGITYEEDVLEDNFKFLQNINMFFKATSTRVQLDKFKTDILYSGGMDPWDSCESSLYPLNIAGIALWTSL